MAIAFAAISTKGGVTKTTTLSNLGAIWSGMGLRVLMVDADVQPSLSKRFPIAYVAPEGLVEFVHRGYLDERCISHTGFPNLHLVRSNDGEGDLQFWLRDRPDRRSRIHDALNVPLVQTSYDVILIDTQGAIGPLQTAAAFAADVLISPLPPDTPSAREFRSGTLAQLRRLESDPREPVRALAPIKAIICKTDRSRDSRDIVEHLRKEFLASDRVDILDTAIPLAAVYRQSFTQGVPVHLAEQRRPASGTPSAFEVMHRLAWALLPQTYGTIATATGPIKADPEAFFQALARRAPLPAAPAAKKSPVSAHVAPAVKTKRVVKRAAAPAQG